MDNSALLFSDAGAGVGKMRDKIARLETAILTLPQTEVPLTHHFAPGIYMREGHMPAGMTFTGKIHLTEHYCILVSGEVTIATEDGAKRFIGPCVIHAMPGTKRAAHCHTDVVWINVHANPDNETDLEKVEAMLVTTDFDDPELLTKTAGGIACFS